MPGRKARPYTYLRLLLCKQTNKTWTYKCFIFFAYEFVNPKNDKHLRQKIRCRDKISQNQGNGKINDYKHSRSQRDNVNRDKYGSFCFSFSQWNGALFSCLRTSVVLLTWKIWKKISYRYFHFSRLWNLSIPLSPQQTLWQAQKAFSQTGN